ncbi:MAG: hypothetical protein KDK78_09925, partial [Chlamydiia bacterium]|nr:hypothetical protein [Chlamydiia bacterium]
MHAPRLDSIQLYSAAEHPALDWPETEEAQAVRQMFEPIAKDGFEQDFCNIHSQLLLLRLKNAVLPAMLCEGAYDDAFISNVVGQYTDYSRDELDSFDSKHLRWGAYAFLTVLKSALIRFQVNKCIAINNWPFASNLHPELSVDDLQAIKELCIERYPDHAVLFRSVNPELDAGLCFGLESCGFQEIFSRQVWMLNPDAKTLKIRHLKKDLQLLEDSPYRILKHHEIRQEDAP